jgi:hypothetical protein
MSSKNNMIKVSDPRINRISDKITQVVKTGAKSTLQEKFPTVIANANNITFNCNIPSIDTLIDRNNMKIKCPIVFNFKKVIPAGVIQYEDGTSDHQEVEIIAGAVCAFPLNSICETNVAKINGVSLTVPTQNVMNILLKQYDQKTISEFNGTTPSYVDTYFGRFTDSTLSELPTSASPLGDIFSGRDDVVQRGAYPVSYRVFYQNNTSGVWAELPHKVGKNKSFKTLALARNGVYIVQCAIDVNEPILGLAPMEAFSSSESSLLGIRNFELKLGLNDCSNIWNEYSDYVVSEVKGGIHQDIATVAGLVATNHPIAKEAELRLTQLTIHDSDFGKVEALSKLPILTYEAQVSPILNVLATEKTALVSSLSLSLGFIPDKFYIQVRVPYEHQHSKLSNSLGYAIKNLKIKFNNKASILNEQDTHELYLTSKKNGSNQSWPEFSGKITTREKTDIRGIGSIIVVDPTMDLDIADVLSSGSSGAFTFQVTVEFENAVHYGQDDLIATNNPYELVVMYSYSNILTTKQGKTALELSYLTMEDVIKTKAQHTAIDYNEFTEMMDGGRRKPIPLNGVGDYLRRSGRVIDAAKDAVDAVKGSGYNASGGGYSKSGGGYSASGGGYSASGGGYNASGGSSIDKHL